jgi:VWFA-related protein
MIRRAVLVLMCPLQVFLVCAQKPAFRAQTNVVQIPVSVTEKNGRDVEGLTAPDFAVTDDGKPRDISLDEFGPGAAPISLVVAVQTSGISTPALKKLQRIGGMIQPLVIGTRGEAAVVTFDTGITWVQDFTTDPFAVRDALANLKPWKSTQARMLDAIAEIVDRLKERRGRKVLLLISESRDRSSTTRFEDALDAVQREGIEVFGAHYSATATAFTARPEDLQKIEDKPLPNIDAPDGTPTTNVGQVFIELARLAKTNAVEALTQATGGSDYPFARERGIEAAIEKLGVEVHSQYILNFPLPQGAYGIHKIGVSVRDHPEYRIRARQTYSAR